MVKRLNDSHDENGNLIDQYKIDELPREVIANAINQYYNVKYKSNDVKYAIDIISDFIKNILYEIEYGKSWFGNRWPKNLLTHDLFGLGRNTINLEDRKFYIWAILAKLRPENDEKIHMYDGFIIHYVRINADYNQIVIVPDDVIRDPNKRHFVPNARVSNVSYDEDYFCFYEEDCITLNLQLDGTWVDSRDPNGIFQPTMARGAQMFRQLKNNKQ